MLKGLFDRLTLFGWQWHDATTPPGAVRWLARRQTPDHLDMIDPIGLRDEAVVTLNELLDLTVGRHSLSLSRPKLHGLLSHTGVGSTRLKERVPLMGLRTYSLRTTFRRELCTRSPPLYSMKPSFLNLFMNELIRGRVVPTSSARVS